MGWKELYGIQYDLQNLRMTNSFNYTQFYRYSYFVIYIPAQICHLSVTLKT